MSLHTVDHDDALTALLSRLLALRADRDGRDVVVRVTTTVDALGDPLVAHVGALGARASEDPDRDGVLFVSVGAGGLTIPRDRLSYVGGTDAGGVAYAIDGGLIVRVEPAEAVGVDG